MRALDTMKRIFSMSITKLNSIVHNIQNRYEGSSKWVEGMANVLVPVTIAAQCVGTGLPIIADVLLFTALFIPLFLLLRKVILWVTKPICKPYFRTVFNGLCLFLSLFIYLTTTVEDRLSNIQMVVAAAVVVLLEHLFVRSLYAFYVNKRRHGMVLVTLLTTLLCNVVLTVFIFGSGIHTNVIERYLKIEKTNYQVGDDSIYTKALEDGKYTTAYVDYGTTQEDALSSTTIDLSSYLWDNTGIKQWTRETYLGYGADRVPLKGRIWYPLEAKNCPVLFIIHGNHSITTDSYLGYAYLGEHLASRGYVVVSVDENICNYYLPDGLNGENSARAYLLLENMRQVQTYNEKGPLSGKMNYGSLAIMGHSRGGEAVALAALYNQLGHNPDVGYRDYSYQFAIKSVIAVAPTVDQYMPAGRDVTLTDVNYLLIQGTNDQDVNSFMGQKQYNDMKFTGITDCYKTYLYIAGANHGQFNTNWQQDYVFPRNLMLNQADVMDGTRQRDILTGYTTAFLDNTLSGETSSRSLFQENNHISQGMPETIYVSGYEDSSFEALADYEEDIALDTITAKTGEIYSRHLCFNSEKTLTYEINAKSYDINNHAAYLWWNSSNAEYGIDFANQSYNATQFEYFQFDVADVKPDQDPTKKTQLLDFEVVLKDSKGNVATVELGKVSNIYPTILTRLYKLQLTRASMDEKSELQTVRIPIELFFKDNHNLDASSLTSVEWHFTKRQEGRILLDNIGFAK